VLLLPTHWDPLAMGLTFVGGAVGGFGLILFYRAMALDLIGVVAPITAVIAASLPTAVGVIVGGERLRVGQAAGIAAGLVAIVLINGGGRAARQGARRAVALAIVAGVTFGLFFILYHQGSSAGVGAFVTGRVGSMLVAVSYSLITRVRLLPLAASARPVALAGVLDGVGVILYMFATTHGLLSITALLTSFYPAFTILCARFVLHERLSAIQAAGAGLAVVAVAAIAAA
jgi:drug/metabolite transporter (DMT)-like permease